MILAKDAERLKNAKWIAAPGCSKEAAPVFKKEIFLDDVAKNAKIYISGLGFYVLKINGIRVEDDILQPAFSNYENKVYYNVYDISDYLKKGVNVVEVTLGNGWYNQIQKDAWGFEKAVWRKPPQLIAEIFTDGVLKCATDSTWLQKESATVYNSLRGGETYDASRLNADGNWKPAAVVDGPMGILKEQKIKPIRIEKYIDPISVIKNSDYDYVYDFGINLSGNAEIYVEGESGLNVSVQYFERLLDGHNPDLHQISQYVGDGRFQRDVYITGDENTPWHGEFSYHGFRYVRITFAPGAVIKSVKARFFHTVAEDMGSIKTDNAVISKIQSAIRQSTLSNLHHIPTDCPHREKNGWAADGYLSCGQALFNFDMENIYEKWLDDFVDCQKANGKIPCIAPTCGMFGYGWGSGPSWDAVLFVIPWRLYQFTGNIKYIKRYYEPMKKYIRYLDTITENGICKLGLGEWCAVESKGDHIPDEVVIEAAVYGIYKLYLKAAEAMEDTDEIEYAKKKSAEIKKAFILSYGDLKLENQLYWAGRLYFDLFDSREDRKAATDYLVRIVEKFDRHIYGGIFNAYILLKVLTDEGRFDIAYDVATRTDFPSWSDMIDRCGGTLGEEFYGGLSLNHHMFSPIGEWFYTAIAGINIDEAEPGFKNIIIKPHIPADIKNFAAWHKAPCGKTEVCIDPEKIRVKIPHGSTAVFKYKEHDVRLNDGEYIFER